MTALVTDGAGTFSSRSPACWDGHGNFGSVDDDSAAAMRYTEIRLPDRHEGLLRTKSAAIRRV